MVVSSLEFSPGDSLAQAMTLRLVETMHCGRVPCEAHRIPSAAVQFTFCADCDRLVAERAGDDRVGAEIFDRGDRGIDAVVREMDILGTDADGDLVGAPGEALRPVRARQRQRGSRHDIHRRRADESRREHRRGTRVHFVGRRVLLDVPVAQQDHLVGHAHRLGLVVRHVHHRHPELLLQRADLAAHFVAQLRVEVRQRLVHQADRLLGDDRATECHALLLSAGELVRLALEQMAQSEQFGDALQSLLLRRRGCLADLEPEQDVLGDRKMREQRIRLEHHRQVAPRWRLRGDVVAGDENAARVGQLEARDQPECR